MINSLLFCSNTSIAATVAGTSTAVGKSSFVSSIIMIFIYIVIGLVVITGLVFLQIFLSKARSKWPGLILPGCSMILSIVVVLEFLYNSIDASSIFLNIITISILFNIPTLVYLAIYKVVRSNRKKIAGKNQEINKMSIQDLE